MMTISATLNCETYDETACTQVTCPHPSCWETWRRFSRGVPHFRQTSGGVTSDKNKKKNNVYVADGQDDSLGLPTVNFRYFNGAMNDSFEPLVKPSPTATKSELFNDRVGRTVAKRKTNGDAESLVLGKQRERAKFLQFNEGIKQIEEDISTMRYVWVCAPNRHHKVRKEKTDGVIKVKDCSLDIPLASESSTKASDRFFPRLIKRARKRCCSPRHLGVKSFMKRDAHTSNTRNTEGSLLHDLRKLPAAVLESYLNDMEEGGIIDRDLLANLVTETQRRKSMATGSTGQKSILQPKQISLTAKRFFGDHECTVNPVFKFLDSTRLNVEKEHDFDIYKKPLPSIPIDLKDTRTQLVKLSTVSLGLPEIPHGLRYTRPFNYSYPPGFDLGLDLVPSTFDEFPESESFNSPVTFTHPGSSQETASMDVHCTSTARLSTPKDRKFQRFDCKPALLVRLPKSPNAPLSLERERVPTSGKLSSKASDDSDDILTYVTTLSPRTKISQAMHSVGARTMTMSETDCSDTFMGQPAEDFRQSSNKSIQESYSRKNAHYEISPDNSDFWPQIDEDLYRNECSESTIVTQDLPTTVGPEPPPPTPVGRKRGT